MMKALPFHCLNLLLIIAQARSAEGDKISYHLYSFEAPRFEQGSLSGSPQGLRLVQGTARIAATQTTPGSAQHLVLDQHGPHSAVLLTGKRLAGDHRSHGEVWVRPQATSSQNGEEFMDFDGAVVGLFRRPDEASAEFHAFHQITAVTGCWLSTGQMIGIDEQGAATQWHRLNIEHHWEAGTWSLKVDGAVGLTGLQRSGRVEPDRFECWLFGQEQGDCAFDDLLITPLAPDQLEAQASAGQLLRRTPAEPAGRSRPRVATGKQLVPRRHTALPKPPAGQPTAPGEFDFHLKVVGGGRHIAEIDLKEKPEGQKRIALYSPGYDAAGQPLPLQVEIRCDAHLGEGVVLADLHWAITEAGDAESGELRPVLVHGDFSTGPTQLATVPSKWSNKALSIQVAPHLIKAIRGR